MQIKAEYFNDNYKELLWGAKLFMIPRARNVVLQQYCNKLSTRNACSGDCNICGARIADALKWMADNNTPRMAYGIFGKLMKNAFAKQLEEMLKRPTFKPEVNLLGEETERDALDILMETFNG